MMMNRFFAYVVVMLLTMTMASPASAMTNDDDYEAQTVATSWYADRCQSIITRFEGLRNNAGQLPQKYCMMPSSEAGAVKYALVVSTWDESMKVMYTPQGNDVKAKVFSGVVPEDIYWESLPRLLSYATHSRDITLSKRPLPVRYVDKEHNSFSAVTDYSEKLSNIRRYNQMMFKPHVNEVRFVKQNRKVNKGESNDTILDEMVYDFKLVKPAVVAKMFRGYANEEMCPWIVTNDFFTDHNVLQFSRWKDGEPKQKASSDVCKMISTYYGGRRVVDSQWLASVDEAERSFYLVQFENKDGDALAALVCLAEGDVASAWEFHGDTKPREYKNGESIWFVDDGGSFMEHVPELQCIVATNEGLELYIRMFGGESVQYYVVREIGSVMMTLQVDYWIYAWEY